MNGWPWLAAVLLLLHAGVPAAADSGPDSFAYALALPEARERGVYAVALPEEVYVRRVFADGRDIRVFNANGEPVPQALRRPAVEGAPREEVWKLPLYPLYGPAAGPVRQDEALEVAANPDGSVHQVRARSVTGREGRERCGYLLDLTAVRGGVDGIELTWEAPGQDWIAVRLSHSADLVHWKPLVDKAALVRLRRSGHCIEQNRISLHTPPLPYLRLERLDSSLALELRGASAYRAVAPVRRNWLALQAQPVRLGAQGRDQHFIAPAGLRATGVRLRLPASLPVAEVRVRSRSGEGDQWVVRADGLLYDLQLQGRQVRRTSLDFAPVSDPLWQLSLLEDGGLPQATMQVGLELGWIADDLVFIGQGPAPYILAYGNAGLRDAPPLDNLVLRALEQGGAAEQILRIGAGPSQILQGAQALQPTLPWGRVALWAALAGGVLILAYMAKRLYREMNEDR